MTGEQRARGAALPAALLAVALAVAVAIALGGCAARASSSPAAPLPRAAYAHYLAGRAAVYDEEPAAAVPHLRAALAAAPDEPQLAIALIDALREAGEPAAAHVEARRALQRWPRRSAVWRATGELLASEGAYPAAIRAYRRAVALDPRDEAAHVGLIATLQSSDTAETGSTRGAMLAAARQLLAHLPDSSDGHYLLGQLLAERGEHAAAIRELRATVRLTPGHLDGRAALAEQLRLAGRLPEAIAESRSAFDRSGEDLELAEPLLGLLCQAGDRRAALDLVGLYDDAERATSELLLTGRWALELDELPLAERLLHRALGRALAEDGTDDDTAAELAEARRLSSALLLARLHAPFGGAGLAHRNCASR